MHPKSMAVCLDVAFISNSHAKECTNNIINHKLIHDKGTTDHVQIDRPDS